MGQPVSKNNSYYYDKYFPQEDESYPPGAGDFESEGNYGDFYSEESFESGSGEEFGLEEDSSEATGELGGEGLLDPAAEEPAYTDKQKRLIASLDTIDEKVHSAYEKAQNALDQLQSGTGNHDERLEQLSQTKKLLEELEQEFELYQLKEDLLEKTGLEADSIIDNPLGEDFEKEFQGMDKSFDGVAEQLAKESEAKVQEIARKAEGAQLKERVLESLGHLTFAKKPYYFTGRVWNVDSKTPHIRKYYDGNQGMAQTLMSDIAEAFETGDWASSKASLEALPPDYAAHTVNLVFAVLEREAPGVLEKLPGDVLNIMSATIQKGDGAGDDPKKYGVFIDTKAKYKPKSNQIRYGVEKYGKNALTTAEKLTAMANSAPAPEESDSEETSDSYDDGYENSVDEEVGMDENPPSEEATAEEEAVDEALE